MPHRRIARADDAHRARERSIRVLNQRPQRERAVLHLNREDITHCASKIFNGYL